MKMATKTTGIGLAVAAATLFSVAPLGTVSAAEKTGKCYNVNACKGHSACATATTSCAGQNSCAGKGWVKKTKPDCEADGGEFKA